MTTDFHLHTTASDGALDPAGLVRELASRGIRWAAITDHDTVAGWDGASTEASRVGVDLVPGAELSVVCHGERIHMLALGIETGHPSLVEWLDAFRRDRQARADAVLEKLRERGIPFDPDVLPVPSADRVITRPHLADSIVAAGGASTADEAFERFLGDGAPCFVAVPPRSSADAIRRVHEAGGIAVLAHPADWTAHRTVLALIGEGLDGIEVGHPMHDDVLTEYYGALAVRYGLVVTAGSDFHGRHSLEFERLGSYPLEEPHGDLLRERLLKARSRA